jgi:transcriptional regulator with XRE-family HTH domain
MKLADYLTENNISDAEFARLIGVERQAVHRYKSPKKELRRIPAEPVMKKIAEKTGNAVTANDFFDMSPSISPAEQGDAA